MFTQSQATAIHCHAVAGLNLSRDMGRCDLQLPSALRRTDLERIPDFFNQACEHDKQSLRPNEPLWANS